MVAGVAHVGAEDEVGALVAHAVGDERKVGRVETVALGGVKAAPRTCS